MTTQVNLTLTRQLRRELWEHLFPGDQDEHGAVILAGYVRGPGGFRLLGKHLLLAQDGVDYVPGRYGYRALTASFVQRAVIQARDAGLIYLAVHCHGGDDDVAFSSTDLASHERGYPALMDITGIPVGGLVAARHALAGELWLPGGARQDLNSTLVPNNRFTALLPHPGTKPSPADETLNRQALLFGDRGQTLIGATSVTIIGLGGLGSIIAELLARLGVQHFVLIDPDRVDLTNLNRMVAARRLDALGWLRDSRRPAPLRAFAERRAQTKVSMAARNIRRANPRATVVELPRNLSDPLALAAAANSQYLFLAADTNLARHLTNALVQQYLIPGVQAGVKIRTDDDGVVHDLHVAIRPLIPGDACLWCQEVIDPAKLAIEMLTRAEQHAAQYVAEVTAPAVMSLNGIAASEAVTAFMLGVTGLAPAGPSPVLLRLPLTARLLRQIVSGKPSCRWCGTGPDSRLARGSLDLLPTQQVDPSTLEAPLPASS